MDDLEQGFFDAIMDFDEDDVIDKVKELLDHGKKPEEVAEIARQAMDQVGKMFEEKEIFLTELIMAGELLKVVMDELGFSPDQIMAGGEVKGKIVIGTVEGDVHDIGKSIVIGLLSSNGYAVVDLGVEVPPTKFVEAVKRESPDILALCGLLTIAYDAMKKTIDELNSAGLRDKVKIMIGGGATDEKVCDYVGADACGKTAVAAVELAKSWMS